MSEFDWCFVECGGFVVAEYFGVPMAFCDSVADAREFIRTMEAVG